MHLRAETIKSVRIKHRRLSDRGAAFFTLGMAHLGAIFNISGTLKVTFSITSRGSAGNLKHGTINVKIMFQAASSTAESFFLIKAATVPHRSYFTHDTESSKN